MAKKGVTLYNIMVGTCGDVDLIGLDKKIIDSITQWNQIHSSGNIYLMPRHWKISCGPSSGKRPQEIINDEITNTSDALVVFLWTYVGDGVREEIENFLNDGKPVLLYFYEAPVDYGRLEHTDMEGIKKLKEDYKNRLLYSPVPLHTSEEIEGKLFMGLTGCLDRLERNSTHTVEKKLEQAFSVNEDKEVRIVDFAYSRYENYNFTVRNSNRTFVWKIPEEYVRPLTDKWFLQNNIPETAGRPYSTTKTADPEIMNRLLAFLDRYFSGLVDVDSLLEDCARRTAEFFLAKEGTNNFNGSVLGVYQIARTRTIDNELPKFDLSLYSSDYFTFKFMSILYQELRKYNSEVFMVRTPDEVNRLVPFLNSVGIGGFIFFDRGKGTEFLFAQRGKGIACENQWHFSFDETFSLMDQHQLSGVWEFDDQKCLRRGLREEVGVNVRNLSTANNFKTGYTDIMVIATQERFEFEICGYARFEFSKDYTYQDLMEKYKIAPDANWESSAMLPVNIKDVEKFMENKDMTPECKVLIRRLKARIKEGSLPL